MSIRATPFGTVKWKVNMSTSSRSLAGDGPSSHPEFSELILETVWLDISEVDKEIVANVVIGIRIHQLCGVVRHDLVRESVVVKDLILTAIRNIVEGVRIRAPALPYRDYHRCLHAGDSRQRAGDG
jgi:hypothetical protein